MCENDSKIKNSTSKSKVFLTLPNGRRPPHDDNRNMAQANFYLIMTVQTNYLTVIKIWCLKSAKNFTKNNCLKGTNHIATVGNRSAEGGNRSATVLWLVPGPFFVMNDRKRVDVASQRGVIA